jgi:hypothetical protein
MRRVLRFVSLLSVSVLPVVAAAGCATGKAAASDADARGMLCPKCETVWVTRSVGQGTKVQRLASERQMTCPECDATAKSQLSGDGTVTQHNCPTCKVALQPVQPSPQSAGSPKG